MADGLEHRSVDALDPTDVDLGILDETLSFYVRLINTAVSRDLDQRLQGLDVARGTGKVSTLLLVDRHPGIRPSLIADVIMKDRSAIGRIVDEMVRQGLMERVPSQADSRALGLFLTTRGTELAVTVREIVRQSRHFFDELDQADYDAAVTLLRKIYWRVVARRAEGSAS
ncbi:MarR family transcriptional regulator [Aureimonas altamirensis]|uniref:MarR family winged helix-turn-helix transcriptional regulator n=1 Tax=Aureimonas altamirensis TaxID=370622 RepID=UPI001E2E1AEA|nr:MarR family transcriptional regulator [Aureimonas altamirensis]UHD43877.1 MarR family transcriptional regulator [Aureimonas altamirensis]